MPEAWREDWQEAEIPAERKGPSAGAGEIMEIPMEQIIEPTTDVRRWIPQEHIDSLAASLAAVGLIHEIVVVPRNGMYEIVSGHCRFLAAKKLGWETIRAKVIEAGEVDREFTKLHENMFRADLSPVEKAEFLAKIKDRYRLTDNEIAMWLGKSRAWVTRYLKANTWPEDVKDAVRDGIIGFEVAWELSKIPEAEYRHRLIEYATRDGCTRRLAKLWVEDYFRTKRAMEAIAQREMEELPQETAEQLLDEARVKQLQLKEDLRQSHRILEYPCDVCQNHWGEDQLIYLRVCPDCVHLINNAIRPVTQGA